MSRKTLVPREYQISVRDLAVQRLLGGSPGQIFMIGLGLGKTISSLLTWLEMRRLGKVDRLLILAPKRVAELVWPQELAAWDTFEGLTVVNLCGKTPKQRETLIAERADITIATVDSAAWLGERYDTKGKQRVLPDMLIVDESSYFKTWSSKRNKGLRKVLPRFKARLLLTATPRSSSVLNLFPQAYLTDGGETLGKRVGAFKSKFGYQGGFKGYEWIPFPDTDDKVNELMEPISIRLDTQDYANMPELFVTSQTCQMPAKAKREYDRLSKEMFLYLSDGEEHSPVNAGTRYLSCKQLSGGALYYSQDGEEREVEHYHSAKLEMLLETIQAAQGPCLVAYQFDFEREMICGALRKEKYRIATINGATKAAASLKAVEDWNEDRLDVLVCQCQSVSHGINLHKGSGRNVIWYGLTDLPEVYSQFNGRLYRPGIEEPVVVTHLLTEGTLDADIEARLSDKAAREKSMLDYLRDQLKKGN